MDLWIRSQNREYIVKINSNVFLKYDDKKKIIANYIPDFSDKYDGSYDDLGTYESKERALEVLDEIQNIIYMNKLFNANMNAFKLSLEELDMSENEMNELLKKISVYEMPKE